MSEFSVTLPCNLKRKHATDNIPSKYTTPLVKQVKLHGSWEVAATRLQYQNNWSTLVKEQHFGVFIRSLKTLGQNNFLPSQVPGDIERHHEYTVYRQQVTQWKQASWARGFLGNMHFRRVALPTQKYDTVLKLGRALANAINLAFYSLHEDLKIRYEIDKKSARVRFVCSGAEGGATYVVRIVTLSTPVPTDDVEVMDTLGFHPSETGVIEPSGLQATPLTWKYYGITSLPSAADVQEMSRSQLTEVCQVDAYYSTIPQLPASRHLYLYCDLVEARLVGDSQSRLLDTVVVNSNFGQTEDALRSTKPNYVPLDTNEFDSIEIKLTDHAGDLIEFTNPYSPVIVTLHFRKARSRN